jgi:hypothetical protein
MSDAIDRPRPVPVRRPGHDGASTPRGASGMPGPSSAMLRRSGRPRLRAESDDLAPGMAGRVFQQARPSPRRGRPRRGRPTDPAGSPAATPVRAIRGSPQNRDQPVGDERRIGACIRGPGRVRARASSRSTVRRMARAVSSIPSARCGRAGSRRRRSASPIRACKGVFSPWARSAARARARSVSASRAASRSSISAPPGAVPDGQSRPCAPPAHAQRGDPRAEVAQRAQAHRQLRPARRRQHQRQETQIGRQIGHEGAARGESARTPPSRPPPARFRHPAARAA